MFANSCEKKSLAGRVEKDRGPLLNERANLVELRFGQPDSRNWVLFHVRRSAPASTRRMAEVAASGAPPREHAILQPRPRFHRTVERAASGTARAPHSVDRRV